MSFPHMDLNPSIYDSQSEDDSNPPDITLEGPYPRRQEVRIANLEGEVSTIRSDVAGINSKLDKLVEAATARPVPILHSTPPRRRHTPKEAWNGHEDSYPHERLPPPRTLRRDQNLDGYVDDYSRRDRFAPPTVKGKQDIHDSYGDMRKPYMYISRETCQTTKQKLEVRCKLGALEYINAMVKLSMDASAYDPRDLPHILRHLRDVTHDAMERPWGAVRKWSQSIFDAIERGDFCWADRQDIHNERVRIAMTGPQQSMTSNKPGTGQGAEYLCRDFNSRSGCRHRGDHNEGSVKLLHVCAFCDAVSKQCVHSVVACDRKLQFPSGRPQRQQFQYSQQQPQQFRMGTDHYQPQPLYQSKNGPSAPRPF